MERLQVRSDRMKFRDKTDYDMSAAPYIQRECPTLAL
jgi:hypothetical protein